MSDYIETLADRYGIISVLGEGALGRTMLADDSESGEKVAVKELLPSRMKRWKDLDLFHRECRTLKALSHEGIPTYIDDFVIESENADAPPRLFLVQQFVRGKSLQDMLDEGHEFSEDEVRDVAIQTLEVLRYLHELNPPVIHRDLKPANLMRMELGRIMVIDFGAVREAITFDGVGSTIVGTFGYMPPEQYAGMSVAATDLFALGATCVQLISGRPPTELFKGLHHFELPSDLPITVGLERVLLKLTEPEVSNRYQSAQAVLDDLGHGFLMVQKESVTTTIPIPHEIIPAPRPFPGFYLRDAYHGRSHLIVVIMVILSVLLAAVFPIGGAFLLGQPELALIGFLGLGVATIFGWMVSKKALNEIDVYRRGTYTLGEITGVFWSVTAPENTNLTYRYPIGGEFEHGCLSTADKSYRKLGPGDPVGVIYLPEETSEHVMYAVPTKWAATQKVGLSKRLSSD